MKLDWQTLTKTSSSLLDLYSVTDVDALPDAMVRVASSMIPSEMAAYNEVDYETARIKCIHNSPQQYQEVLNRLPFLVQHLDQHEVNNQHLRNGASGPLKMTDFVPQRSFRNSALFTDFYGPLKIPFYASIYLADTGPLSIALNVHKLSRDFTDEEMSILRLLQPHFSSAHRRLRTWNSTQNQSAANEVGGAVLASDLRIKQISEPAHRLLNFFYGGAGGKTLPIDLYNWVRGQVTAFRESPLMVRCVAHYRKRGDRTIRVWLFPSPESGWRLSFVESFDRAILTRREQEIVHWIREAKTNSEIAIILGISPRTVAKHVENVLRKLDLESRASLVRSP